MKLLLDENLSPRLVQTLEPEYPGSAHVRTRGLRGATDGAIWEVARQERAAIQAFEADTEASLLVLTLAESAV